MKDVGQDPAESSNGGTPEVALSSWWLVLTFCAAQVPIVLLGRFLHMTFNLTGDTMIALSSGVIILCTLFFFAAPRTFRQLGILAAACTAIGLLAMLCYVPFVVFSEGFTIASRVLMFRIFGMLLVAGAGLWVANKTCLWLRVPPRQYPSTPQP